MSEKTFDFDFRWKNEAGEVIADKTAIGKDSPLFERVPENLRALVSEGGITATVGFVTASAKVEGENGKKAEKTAIDSYVRLEAETPQSALFMQENRMKATDDGPGVLTHYNYGYDLWSRGKVRNPLLQKLEGPEKAIERAIKAMLGIPGMTESKARIALGLDQPTS